MRIDKTLANNKAKSLISALGDSVGDEVPPRKRFIQTHAKEVRNLEI